MPTYRGITVSLQSQYDALTIPEQPLPSASSRSEDLLLDSVRNDERYFTVGEMEGEVATPSTRLAEVSVPIYLCSRFWISYSCPTPLPDNDCRFYYFKLFISGKCIVSWGVGEGGNWEGKIVCGLFDGGTDFEGRSVIERLGLFFADKEDAVEGISGRFQIRVYRSKARRREKVVVEMYDGSAPSGGLVSMSSLGRLKKGEARKRYTYALIDAVDEPYATFEYHFESDSRSSNTPTTSTSSLAFASADTGMEKSACASVSKRLSVPPRVQLLPTTTQHKPSSPIKKPRSNSQQVADEPQRSSEQGASTKNASAELIARTPFPIKPEHQPSGSAPPPSERSKNSSLSLLRGAVANALKRRDGGDTDDHAML